MNRELTNEIVSPEKYNPEVKSKNFTHERTIAIISISTNRNLIDKVKTFDFTHSKKEHKFAYQYHYWRVNKKIIDTIKKRDKSPSRNSSVDRKVTDNKTRPISVQL